MIIFALPPIVWKISLLSFYFHSAIILGKFPKYNQPDPKHLHFYENYHNIINSSGNAMVYMLVAGLLSFLLERIFYRENASLSNWIIPALAYFVALLIFFSGVLEWYAD